MAKKNFERGEKRALAISILRKAKINAKSSADAVTAAREKIAKAIGVDMQRARSYQRFCVNEGLVSGAAARKTKKKAKASRSAARGAGRKASKKSSQSTAAAA